MSQTQSQLHYAKKQERREQMMKPTQWALGTLGAIGLAAALSACNLQNDADGATGLERRTAAAERDMVAGYPGDPDFFTRTYKDLSSGELTALDRIEIYRMNEHLESERNPGLKGRLERDVVDFYAQQGVDPKTYGLK